MSKRKDEEEGGGAGAVSVSEDSREVLLVGSLTDDSAGLIIAGIRALDRTRGPIDLVMASSGGDEEAGWAVYDTIRSAKREVRATAYAACHSIAALILQAAKLRLLSENCRMLIHNGSGVIRGHYSVVQAGAKESRFRTQRYYEALAERAGAPVKKIKSLCDKETVLSAEQALTLGLADGIIVRPTARRARSKR